MPKHDKRPLIHPLAGANLSTYSRHWLSNFPFSLRTTPHRLIATLSIAVRSPKIWVEAARLRRRIASQEIEDGPYFLIGHWRSGTTHLHNLLSQDKNFAWLTFVQAGLPMDCMGKFKAARWFIRKVMPETRGMDDVSIHLDSPQEEELALANMNRLSFFNSFYFPRKLMEHYREGVLLEDISDRDREKFTSTYRYLIKKFSYAYDGSPLLMKNPANTARMKLLKELFPKARFIHIVRNPFEVYASMQKLWQQLFTVWSMQKFEHIDTHPITLDIYESLTKRFMSEQPEIPPEDYIEIRFEGVERDPVGELAKIYDYFSLPDRDTGLENIRAYAESLKHYQRSRYELPKAILDEVGERWKFALEHWGYDLPASINPI